MIFHYCVPVGTRPNRILPFAIPGRFIIFRVCVSPGVSHMFPTGPPLALLFLRVITARDRIYTEENVGIIVGGSRYMVAVYGGA